MTETYQLSLPLVEAAQAQKHVTVNEALARLDAVAQLRVVSNTLATPPAVAVDGQAYIVPTGATGAWAGQAGQIALFANGGWVFIAPRTGWSAWNASTGAVAGFDGAGWVDHALTLVGSGAATLSRVIDITHPVSGGGSSTVAAAIPSGSVVVGVSARVTEAIGGTVGSWSMGVAGSPNRYGSGLGIALNSYASGLTGAPTTYYSDTDLLLTAESGSFAGGVVRIAVHVLALTPPRSV